MSKPRIERLNFTTDAGAGDRARIGLLVLESDQTLETEVAQIATSPGVSLYHSRLANDIEVTPETLSKMELELPKAAKLLPRYLNLNAIGYGCTSGTTIIGETKVAKILESAHPGVPATNPLSAAKAAFQYLDVARIALLTPYSPEVTQAMQDNLDGAGIAVNVVGSFYEESDLVVGKISQDSILRAAISIGKSNDVDGVFISCTSLRATGIIAHAEREIGKPVTASNHALAWHLLRLSGVSAPRDDLGALFREKP